MTCRFQLCRYTSTREHLSEYPFSVPIYVIPAKIWIIIVRLSILYCNVFKP